MSQSFTVRGLSKPTRLDRVLRNQFSEWGRQAVQKLISGRKVTVNGRAVWLASWEIGNGDVVTVSAEVQAKPQGPASFEDAWLIAQEDDLIVEDLYYDAESLSDEDLERIKQIALAEPVLVNSLLSPSGKCREDAAGQPERCSSPARNSPTPSSTRSSMPCCRIPPTWWRRATRDA